MEFSVGGLIPVTLSVVTTYTPVGRWRHITCEIFMHKSRGGSRVIDFEWQELTCTLALNSIEVRVLMSTPDEEHQRRLEEASAVCARGRQHWTRDGNAALALQEFEHALQLLETLLGTYHSLTAKTYYWIGFIRKHDSNTYEEALQAFVQTARIRLVLLGPSQESTQEAISAIRWVLSHQEQSNETIKAYLNQLYESIRLETLGDARLRHREYGPAIEYYQQAMQTFQDPTHATIMGKRAFCHFKVGALDAAMEWYRRALLVFTTQTVHGLSHPDIPTTLERMEQVLRAYGNYSAEAIQSYLAQVMISVQDQHAGELAFRQGRFQQALDHYKATMAVEQQFLGEEHSIVQKTIHPLIVSVQKVCETPLEQTISSLQMSNKLLQEQLAAIQGVVAVTETKQEDTRGDTNKFDLQSELNHTEEEVTELKNQLQKIQVEKQEWQRQELETKLRLDDINSKLDLKSSQLEEESKRRTELQQTLERVESQLKDLKRLKEELHQDLKRELDVQVKLVEKLQQQVDSKEAQIQEYQAQQASFPVEDIQKVTRELQEAHQANAEFHKRLLAAETAATSLNEIRRKAQDKLQDALTQQVILKAELEERDDTISKLQDRVKELEESNHHEIETPVGSPSRIRSHSISPGGVSTASSVEPSDTQRQVEAQLRELQTDSRLKSQNERAVKTIQALSKELIGMEEKYRKLGAKHEKLRQLFSKLEQKNRSLKEQNVQILKSSAVRKPALGDSMNRPVPSVEPTSNRSEVSTVIETTKLPEELLKSLRLSKSYYKSSLAEYYVRRPHVEEPSPQELRLFGDTSICTTNYVGDIQNPHTLETVAVIGFDHSRLYFIGTQMIHRRMDGSWTTLESNHEPLGWISYEDSKGQTLYYSLDAIVEEAQIYREHYCQSVSLNASSRGFNMETKLLRWLANQSPVLETLAYSCGSMARTKQTDRPTLAFSIILALFAIILARFWIR